MIELYIERQQADINEGFSTLLTFAVDDVKDFGAKNTAFSKTIVLPGTKRNNTLFGNIFNVNRSTQYDATLPNFGYNYNAATSAAALIFADNIQVFKGILRLMEIVIDNGRIEYEVSVFGELGGFVAKLGNHKLTDNLNADGTLNTIANLDFSAYDHTYNLSNISSSWNTIAGSGYYYPLIDYGTYGRNAAHNAIGKHSWQYKTLRPALYVSEYLTKIFALSGYTYDFPLLTTARFQSLIIPFNRKQLTQSSLVGLSAHLTTQQFTNVSTYSVPFFYLDTLGNFSANAAHTRFTYGGPAPVTGSLSVKLWGYADINGPRSPFYIDVYKNGISVNTTTFAGQPVITLDGLTINPSDVVEIIISTSNNPYTFNLQAGIIAFTNATAQMVEVNINESLKINNAIPKNILQKDFVSSIIKMFNLYVYEDPTRQKHLKIVPFIDFFDGATTIDWSAKLDRSKPIKIKPMSELNARYYEFKFKNDSDFYNELYSKRYNENYGSLKYDSGFEFSKESESVEVIFSGTPLVGYQGEDKVYSTILKSSATAEECIDSNIRILQAKSITAASWDILDMDGTTVLGSYTNYGYAGHYDDPNAPGNDIQFGVPKELFFVLATGAINITQFNVYYSAYMAEITDKDSKLLTATFHLTRMDIAQLSFSNFIWIDGGKFRLNKITDYNATQEDTCICEMIKVINSNY